MTRQQDDPSPMRRRCDARRREAGRQWRESSDADPQFAESNGQAPPCAGPSASQVTFGPRGQRLRSITEHAIIAIKGNPTWNLTNETTAIHADVREDSRKPDEFYALIDAITPAQRSLELFARRELPDGWEGFGDQVGKFATAKAKDKKADQARGCASAVISSATNL
jgi:hypothetical protein